MGWLTLLLAGAHPLLSLDAQIQKRKNRPDPALPQPVSFQHPTGHQGAASKGPVTIHPAAFQSEEQIPLARRQFIMVAGGTILAGALTGGAWLHSLNDKAPGLSADSRTLTLPTPASQTGAGQSATAPAATTAPAGPASAAASAPAATNAATTTQAAQAATAAPATTAAAQPALTGPVVGKLAAIPVGNVLAFTTPNSGTSAYLVHAIDGSVKAFSRICTHEGCEVGFNQPNQVFVCPCHGAVFDATSGAVLRSPARRPLQSFPVQLDASGNIIFTA
jgi:Rieske Fe-S protein